MAVQPPVARWPGVARDGSPTRDRIVQMIKAYRVDRGGKNPKIKSSNGKIEEFVGGSSGIDISFGEREHVDQYFAKKKSVPGVVVFEWDFPDDLYAMIQARIKNLGDSKIPIAWKGSGKLGDMWTAVKKCAAPVPTSDPLAPDKDNAPHFNEAWLEVLTAYGKGSGLKVYTPQKWLGIEEVTRENLPDTEIVVVVDASGDALGKCTKAEAETAGDTWLMVSEYDGDEDIDTLPDL